MVNRTKISREIRRRTGGTGQYKPPTAAEVRAASKNLAPNINETFIHKGKKISAWVKDKTKPISGRGGTIGYQRKLHPEFRKQKQATVKRIKDKQEEDKTVTTDTQTNLERLLGRATEAGPRTSLYSAGKEGSKRAEEERKRKTEKDVGRAKRKKEVKETPFGLRAVRGRAMLKAPAEEALKTRKKFRQERIADAARSAATVTKTDLPTPKVTDPVKLKRLSDAIAATKRREEEADKPRYSTEASKKLKQLIDENEREKERKAKERKADEAFRATWEKTGGKVSRKKGGKVSRNIGGKVWKGGNFEVSQWYD